MSYASRLMIHEFRITRSVIRHSSVFAARQSEFRQQFLLAL